jgi:hypothetical protein
LNEEDFEKDIVRDAFNRDLTESLIPSHFNSMTSDIEKIKIKNIRFKNPAFPS